MSSWAGFAASGLQIGLQTESLTYGFAGLPVFVDEPVAHAYFRPRLNTLCVLPQATAQRDSRDQQGQARQDRDHAEGAQRGPQVRADGDQQDQPTEGEQAAEGERD